jgi:hypothetical protein
MANEILVLRTNPIPGGGKSFELIYLSAVSPPIHIQNDPAKPKVSPATLGIPGSDQLDPLALSLLEQMIPGITVAIDAGDILVWPHRIDQAVGETDAETLAKARSIWNNNATRKIQELRDTVTYFGMSFDA